MNRFYSVLLTFFLVFTASIKAQNVPQTLNSGKYPIEYQFPKNAETEVQEQTTLIVRLSKIFMQDIQLQIFLFPSPAKSAASIKAKFSFPTITRPFSSSLSSLLHVMKMSASVSKFSVRKILLPSFTRFTSLR